MRGGLGDQVPVWYVVRFPAAKPLWP